MLYMLTLGNFVHIFAIPAFAALSDRLGRTRVMVGGAVFSGIAIWPMFLLFDSGDPMLVMLVFLVGTPLIQASMYGPVGAYLSDLFEPTARYSGVSLTYQVGSLLGAGLAPLVAQRLVSGPGDTAGLGWYIVGAYVVSAAAVLLSRSAGARRSPQAGRRGSAAAVEDPELTGRQPA